LEHFEIAIEVNGTEVVLSSQVQVRWSYILEEIEVSDSTTVIETPAVCLNGQRAYVDCKSLENWHNEDTEGSGAQGSGAQIRCALDFVLR